VTVPDHVAHLLDRYLDGHATAAEEATLDAWLATLPAERGTEYRALLGRARAQVAEGLPNVDATVAIAQARERLAGSRLAITTGRRVRWHTLIPAAAAACLVVGVGTLVVWRSGRGWLSSSPGGARATREYLTARGQRETITLADGTQLTLAPGSRLRLPRDDGDPSHMQRTVDLDGEAYFTVRHDATRPFTVRAHGAVVTDVGTEFDVRAYADDPAVRIAVAQGRVNVARKAVAGVPAAAGDMATVTDQGVAIVHHADVAMLTAWTQGRLVFHDTPLSDVARDVGRAFDLDITLSDATLGARPVTAAYSQESPDEVLDLIARVVDARCERVGRHVVIRPRASATEQPGSTVHQPLATAQADPRP
jgi:transmembrane sensor